VAPAGAVLGGAPPEEEQALNATAAPIAMSAAAVRRSVP